MSVSNKLYEAELLLDMELYLPQRLWLFWAGGEDSLVLLAEAGGDHVLLLCIAPDVQGLKEAEQFTWTSPLHPTTFGQCLYSPWQLVAQFSRAQKQSCDLSSCK